MTEARLMPGVYCMQVIMGYLLRPYPSSADVHIHPLLSERKIESQECNVRGLAYHLARHWYNHVLQMVSNPMFTTPPH